MTPLLKQVLERNPGKIKIVFKHFPLKMHAFAPAAAVAAEVAAKTGEFWEFHDELFRASTELNNERILQIAVDLGFDRAKFEKQMKDKAILDRIQADINDGIQAGVQGVPKIFINGRNLKDRSLEGFQKMIDEEIQKLGSQKKAP